MLTRSANGIVAIGPGTAGQVPTAGDDGTVAFAGSGGTGETLVASWLRTYTDRILLADDTNVIDFTPEAGHMYRIEAQINGYDVENESTSYLHYRHSQNLECDDAIEYVAYTGKPARTNGGLNNGPYLLDMDNPTPEAYPANLLDTRTIEQPYATVFIRGFHMAPDTDTIELRYRLILNSTMELWGYVRIWRMS
jgi:hypothetical protein